MEACRMYEGNKEKKISDYLYRTLQNAMEFVAEKKAAQMGKRHIRCRVPANRTHS